MGQNEGASKKELVTDTSLIHPCPSDCWFTNALGLL